MKSYFISISFVFASILTSCISDDSNELAKSDCDQSVIISADEFNSVKPEQMQLFINKLEIDGDCLTINYSASGCDGESWIIKLIDSGDILESLPPHRNLVFTLDNEELCQAVITKETSFDISELREGYESLFLNIKNNDASIAYGEGISTECDQEVIISNEQFGAVKPIQKEFSINRLDIIDNCLRVNYSASGCDGESWVFKLIDSEVTTKSIPAQRSLVLSLDNQEECDAVISKETTFDVSNLRIGEEVILKIINTGSSITY